jgi:hypothetical protein
MFVTEDFFRADRPAIQHPAAWRRAPPLERQIVQVVLWQCRKVSLKCRQFDGAKFYLCFAHKDTSPSGPIRGHVTPRPRSKETPLDPPINSPAIGVIHACCTHTLHRRTDRRCQLRPRRKQVVIRPSKHVEIASWSAPPERPHRFTFAQLQGARHEPATSEYATPCT